MDDETFEVFLTKKNGKKRNFQIVMKNRKIFIMLQKIQKTDISFTDISDATKVFLPFSSRDNENSFILFKRGTCLQFFIADRHQLQKCRSFIDKKLEIFHQTWVSSTVSPLPLPPRSIGEQIREPVDDLYMSMRLAENLHNMISGTASNEDRSEYIHLPSQIFAETAVETTASQDLYDTNYDIPVYNENCEPIHLNPEFSRNQRQMREEYLNDDISYVSMLRSESMNKGGLLLETDLSTVQNIQVIEYDNSVWISKLFRWDSSLPKLYIGDRIVQVNYFEVNNKFEYSQQTKADISYLIIQRLPMGKVFLKSDQVNIKREKNFWMIKTKNKNLKNKLDNYCITEVNRLNALEMENKGQINETIKVEKEYPIIAHPKSFVQLLKTDLK